MTPECHRLAERLQHARLVRRWSEVLAVADQLGKMAACRAGAKEQGGFETCEAPAIDARLGPGPVDELLTGHRLWSDWLGRRRVRKFALVAEKTRRTGPTW